MFHSADFPGSKSSAQNLKRQAVVIGCCNSGHDIAQDYYENGHSVTIVQRSSTLVISADAMRKSLSGLYGEGGPRTEDADMLFHRFVLLNIPRLPCAVEWRLYLDGAS